mgnify:CR=1 FL=1
MTPVDREVIKEYLGDNTTEVKDSITTAKQEIIAKVKEAADAGSSSGGVQTFTEDGTFTVPAGVTKILVTAFGGGGSGGGLAGGQGGNFVIKKAYSVVPKTTIPITIGNGGQASSAGTNGGATVIGSLVTLEGGAKGGQTSTHNGALGGYRDENGQNTVVAHGGRCGSSSTSTGTTYPGGGGGGAGYGSGGKGGNGAWSATNASGANGGIGAGGGGEGSSSSGYSSPGAGGNGIVIIEW